MRNHSLQGVFTTEVSRARRRRGLKLDAAFRAESAEFRALRWAGDVLAERRRRKNQLRVLCASVMKFYRCEYGFRGAQSRYLSVPARFRISSAKKFSTLA